MKTVDEIQEGIWTYAEQGTYQQIQRGIEDFRALLSEKGYEIRPANPWRKIEDYPSAPPGDVVCWNANSRCRVSQVGHATHWRYFEPPTEDA